jgi:hypothetical protein
MAAFFAVVHKDPFAVFSFAGNRLHHTPACRDSVPRVIIDMLAPKALWAMISVAITLCLDPAMFADEIFNTFDER